MANTVIQPPVADVVAVTDPVYAYKNDNGFFSAEFAQTIGTADAVLFTTNGYTFGWKPQNVIYVDSAGNMDVVFGVNQQAVAQVWKNRVSYVGTSQITTDIFDCQENQLKHTIRMVAPPRIPAGYMGTPVQMASGGVITYDKSLQVFADCQVQTTDFEVTGDIGFKDAEGNLIYKLPMIIVEDANGNSTSGTYKVTFNADGTISFYGMVPWDFLQSAAYPVVIDPTVIVSSAYDTSGNGGRKIVRLSNGWIVNVVANGTTMTYWYVSKDNGITWAQLCSASGPSTGGNFAMSSSGTTIYTILTTTTGVQAYKFDASTVTNTTQTSVGSPDSGQSSIGTGCSLAIDINGKLWAAWCSKNSTYPNSFNIRVSSSTDGVTWIAPAQLTTDNSSSDSYTNPCVVLRSNNYPTIIYQFTNSGNNYIYSATWNGSSWASPVIVYSGLTYAQSNPCAAVDSNDVIHVVWYATDATYNSQTQIKYSKSTDGGVTFSVMANITTDNAHPHAVPSISIDSSNNLYVFFQATDAVAYYNVWKLVYNGIWTATKITSNTTGHALNPQTLWSKFNMNSSDAVRYMWQDNQSASVKYDSITFNSPPNAPTLTAHANFDATTAQTLAWTFSDPDSGNTQSAYQLQIYDTTNLTTPVIDTGKVGSTASSYALAANALTQGKNYQWRVQTWDQSGAQGPYSGYSTFKTSATPVATTTAPGTVTSDSYTFTGGYTQPNGVTEQSFEFKLWNQAGTTVVQDSGTIVGTSNAKTFTGLSNNTSYQVEFIVTSQDGVTASSGKVPFSVAYTPPATPTATASNDATNSRVKVDFDAIGNVLNDALTSGANWTTQSGSATYGASGATFGANGSLITGGAGWSTLPITVRATFKLPASGVPLNTKLSLFKDASNSYELRWQNDNNLVVYKTVAGTTTALVSDGSAVTEVSSATYTMTLTLDTGGAITANLYSGSETSSGVLLKTLTCTDTALAGPFKEGVGGDTGTIASTASVSSGAPYPSSFTISRRKTGDTTWKLLQPGATSPFYDYTCPLGAYDYGVTASSAAGSVSDYGTSQVTTSFTGEWLIDESNSANNVVFLYNQRESDATVNQSYNPVQTFAKYPRIRKGQARYRTGNLTALKLSQDGDVISQVDAIDNMCNSDGTYLLKSVNGRIYRVSLSQFKFTGKYGNSIADCSVVWTEVGDV